MLAHPLLLLLVFEHGFIQIRFGIFEFFCFCFMRMFFNTTKFYTMSFFCKHNFFIDEKHTQWMFRSSHQRRSLRTFCCWKFHKIHRKTPVPETFFNKVEGLRPANLLRKRLWPQACNFIKKETGTGVFLWILWNF